MTTKEELMLEALKAAFYEMTSIEIGHAVERNNWQWTDDSPRFVNPNVERVRVAIFRASEETV